MTKKLTKEELAKLVPEGCRLNWNERQNRYYVFKSTYKYDPTIKRSRENRLQVGTIVDGVFRYSKSFLMKQQLKEYKELIDAMPKNASDKVCQTVTE